jgi:uncharacterized hydrophobic protein (TIGR00271 family)
VLRLEIYSPSNATAAVAEVLRGDPSVSALAVMRAASLQPPGDLVLADVAREGANEVIDQLRELGVHHDGTIHVEPVETWISRAGLQAEQRAPGSSADSVVWSAVVNRAYDDCELNWTYLSFMTLATLIAGIAIILDSQILVIGAMVLGPEFGAVAGLGVALVRRRPHLLRVAAQTLLFGFVGAIAITASLALVGRALGWITQDDVVGERPETAFIYSPDRWSFLVALIAAAAGVLSLTSGRLGGISGVFISVTTVPAAGNVALGLAFGLANEVWGSALQLAINISAMALAGWATLALQQALWSRVGIRRPRVRYGTLER